MLGNEHYSRCIVLRFTRQFTEAAKLFDDAKARSEKRKAYVRNFHKFCVELIIENKRLFCDLVKQIKYKQREEFELVA